MSHRAVAGKITAKLQLRTELLVDRIRRELAPEARGSSPPRFGGELTQSREAHDGVRGKFLRQFHAALIGGAIGVVEIDVGQLLGTAQGATLDVIDIRSA